MTRRPEYNLLSLGIEAFISKPFDIKELVAHIDRILRNKYRLVRKLKEGRHFFGNRYGNHRISG